MAHFFAEIEGSRGIASRLGTKQSGLWGHIRGWDVGARVRMEAYSDGDCANLTATVGSNGSGRDVSLGYVQRDAKGRLYFHPSAELCAGLGIKYSIDRKAVFNA